MRMPRMQVYLPDDLYEKRKARGLPASELLQNAVRAELKRQDLLAETDKYLTSLVAQVGRPFALKVCGHRWFLPLFLSSVWKATSDVMCSPIDFSRHVISWKSSVSPLRDALRCSVDVLGEALP
jgi:hypothetical protein